MVCVFSNFILSLYIFEVKHNPWIGPWKRKCLAEFGIVTQCIAPTRINDQYLTNVLLKINAKVPYFVSLSSNFTPLLSLFLIICLSYTVRWYKLLLVNWKIISYSSGIRHTDNHFGHGCFPWISWAFGYSFNCCGIFTKLHFYCFHYFCNSVNNMTVCIFF